MSVDCLDGVYVCNGVVTWLDAHHFAIGFVSVIDGDVAPPTATLVKQPKACQGRCDWAWDATAFAGHQESDNVRSQYNSQDSAGYCGGEESHSGNRLVKWDWCRDCLPVRSSISTLSYIFLAMCNSWEPRSIVAK